jgi:glutamine amidotransferase
MRPRGVIAIVNYGMGNVGAIRNMLGKIGAAAVITADAHELRSAGRLIVPGIGAFDQGMEKLEHSGLVPLLRDIVFGQRTPILGICLGMQLFARGSEEGGGGEGLGWVDAQCVRFRPPQSLPALKVPHMRWNRVRSLRPCALFDAIDYEEQFFYFVHSYHVVCGDAADIVGTTPYGGDFVSVLQHDNIYGVQFHPEKSHRFGMRLLRRFVEMRPDA